MLPDRVSNPGPLTYESGALPIALRGRAPEMESLVSDTEKSQPEHSWHMLETRPRGYKTFFMLNSTEHEFFPAHKC